MRCPALGSGPAERKGQRGREGGGKEKGREGGGEGGWKGSKGWKGKKERRKEAREDERKKRSLFPLKKKRKNVLPTGMWLSRC